MNRIEALSASVSEKQAQFLEVVADMRPRLHRYCARMSGSVLDGEDIVQDTLAQAFFNLSTLNDPQRLEPWLFRIAHNKSIDFLRRRKKENAYLDEAAAQPDVATSEDNGTEVGLALTTLVTNLPPKERACVLLKDALGYSLTEVAGIVDSTVEGVKAALHRGRGKLSKLTPDNRRIAIPAAQRGLIQDYIAHFNRRDWDGVLALVRADARLELVGHTDGNAREFMAGRYLTNYAGFPWRWRFALAFVDGIEMPVLFEETASGWQARAALHLAVGDGGVAHIRDYFHVDYLLDGAMVEAVGT